MRLQLCFILIVNLAWVLKAQAGAQTAHLSCDQDKFWVQGIVPADFSVVHLKVETGDQTLVFIDKDSEKNLSAEQRQELKGQTLILSLDRNCFFPKKSYECEIQGVGSDKSESLIVKSLKKSLHKTETDEAVEVSFDAKITLKSKKIIGGAVQVSSARCLWKYKIP